MFEIDETSVKMRRIAEIEQNEREGLFGYAIGCWQVREDFQKPSLIKKL